MNIKVNFKKQVLSKYNANLILFADEKFNITGLKKHISNSEYSYISDILKKKDTKKKINTFASVFPASNPKYSLVVMLDEPKTNSDYVYNYRDGSGIRYKGTPFNTAGWTSVEVVGQIIEKIGPILATKYNEVY